MTTSREGRTPWTAQRDEVFFRIVQSLFSPAWLSAAGVMLSSYDDANDYVSRSRRLHPLAATVPAGSLLRSGSHSSQPPVGL